MYIQNFKIRKYDVFSIGHSKKSSGHRPSNKEFVMNSNCVMLWTTKYDL